MSFKSILSIWEDEAHGRVALQHAINMVRKVDGHLSVMCLGIDRIQPGLYYAGATPLVLSESIETARENARRYEGQVTQILSDLDINWSSRAVAAQVSGIYNIVGLAARFNDLVVLPQPYGEGHGPEAAASAEAALFHGHAPVLVCPNNSSENKFSRIVVAWNESAAAMSAVRAAIPLISSAQAVDIAIIDPPKHADDRADPGLELSQMLSRHGPKVSVSVLARTVPKIAEILQRHARDIGADLIVMGAYGHSRFRESILGGATRDMLQDIQVPVLMAH